MSALVALLAWLAVLLGITVFDGRPRLTFWCVFGAFLLAGCHEVGRGAVFEGVFTFFFGAGLGWVLRSAPRSTPSVTAGGGDAHP